MPVKTGSGRSITGRTPNPHQHNYDNKKITNNLPYLYRPLVIDSRIGGADGFFPGCDHRDAVYSTLTPAGCSGRHGTSRLGRCVCTWGRDHV